MVSRRVVLSLTTGLAAGLAGCSGAGTPTPGDSASGGPMPQRHAYGSHDSQWAELTLPPGSDTVPVVVVVHGGFWRTGYGAELGQPLAADLVQRGWAAYNLEYRRVGLLGSGGGGWPNTCLDVATAVDALAGPVQDLAGGRLDLSRVVALGHSAGGHLAGWLGARPTLPPQAPGASPRVRLRGFVSQAGVLDLVGAANEKVGGSAVKDFMGGRPDKLAEAYAWASPLARVPMGIPSVCVHGSTDYTVPISQSERFVAAATAAGDDATLQTYGGGHFELIDVASGIWPVCIEALTRLIGR